MDDKENSISAVENIYCRNAIFSNGKIGEINYEITKFG